MEEWRDEYVEGLQALADKQKGLLKRTDKYAKKTGKCLFCRMWGNEKTDNWQHAPDCKLAEAIDE